MIPKNEKWEKNKESNWSKIGNEEELKEKEKEDETEDTKDVD